MCAEKKIEYSALYDLLTEYNEKFNLTAITGYDDFLLKHIDDSRLGLPYVTGTVLDIGSGAGFPALVLKNEKPDIELTMIDSVRKKVDYLNMVINKFGLEKARAIHVRIEDFDRKEGFDTVTARAVAKLAVLAEYALPFLRVGGRMIAYKSIGSDGEIKEAEKAIAAMGGIVADVKDLPLSDEITRRLVIIEKRFRTPDGYPRKNNKPRTSPIL